MNHLEQIDKAGFVATSSNRWAKRIGNSSEIILYCEFEGFTCQAVNYAKEESYIPHNRGNNPRAVWPIERCLKWARRVEVRQ
jgi:hypothetical protein